MAKTTVSSKKITKKKSEKKVSESKTGDKNAKNSLISKAKKIPLVTKKKQLQGIVKKNQEKLSPRKTAPSTKKDYKLKDKKKSEDEIEASTSSTSPSSRMTRRSLSSLSNDARPSSSLDNKPEDQSSSPKNAERKEEVKNIKSKKGNVDSSASIKKVDKNKESKIKKTETTVKSNDQKQMKGKTESSRNTSKDKSADQRIAKDSTSQSTAKSKPLDVKKSSDKKHLVKKSIKQKQTQLKKQITKTVKKVTKKNAVKDKARKETKSKKKTLVKKEEESDEDDQDSDDEDLKQYPTRGGRSGNKTPIMYTSPVKTSRLASLNAKCKVQMMYENEKTQGEDVSADSSPAGVDQNKKILEKKPVVSKQSAEQNDSKNKKTTKKTTKNNGKSVTKKDDSDIDDDESNEEEDSEDDDEDVKTQKSKKDTVSKGKKSLAVKKTAKKTAKTNKKSDKKSKVTTKKKKAVKKGVKRKRPDDDILSSSIIDTRVSKRVASLNASAIMAASFLPEAAGETKGLTPKTGSLVKVDKKCVSFATSPASVEECSPRSSLPCPPSPKGLEVIQRISSSSHVEILNPAAVSGAVHPNVVATGRVVVSQNQSIEMVRKEVRKVSPASSSSTALSSSEKSKDNLSAVHQHPLLKLKDVKIPDSKTGNKNKSPSKKSSTSKSSDKTVKTPSSSDHQMTTILEKDFVSQHHQKYSTLIHSNSSHTTQSYSLSVQNSIPLDGTGQHSVHAQLPLVPLVTPASGPLNPSHQLALTGVHTNPFVPSAHQFPSLVSPFPLPPNCFPLMQHQQQLLQQQQQQQFLQQQQMKYPFSSANLMAKNYHIQPQQQQPQSQPLSVVSLSPFSLPTIPVAHQATAFPMTHFGNAFAPQPHGVPLAAHQHHHPHAHQSQQTMGSVPGFQLQTMGPSLGNYSAPAASALLPSGFGVGVNSFPNSSHSSASCTVSSLDASQVPSNSIEPQAYLQPPAHPFQPNPQSVMSHESQLLMQQQLFQIQQQQLQQQQQYQYQSHHQYPNQYLNHFPVNHLNESVPTTQSLTGNERHQPQVDETMSSIVSSHQLIIDPTQSANAAGGGDGIPPSVTVKQQMASPSTNMVHKPKAFHASSSSSSSNKNLLSSPSLSASSQSASHSLSPSSSLTKDSLSSFSSASSVIPTVHPHPAHQQQPSSSSVAIHLSSLPSHQSRNTSQQHLLPVKPQANLGIPLSTVKTGGQRHHITASKALLPTASKSNGKRDERLKQHPSSLPSSVTKSIQCSVGEEGLHSKTKSGGSQSLSKSKQDIHQQLNQGQSRMNHLLHHEQIHTNLLQVPSSTGSPCKTPTIATVRPQITSSSIVVPGTPSPPKTDSVAASTAVTTRKVIPGQVTSSQTPSLNVSSQRKRDVTPVSVPCNLPASLMSQAAVTISNQSNRTSIVSLLPSVLPSVLPSACPLFHQQSVPSSRQLIGGHIPVVSLPSPASSSSLSAAAVARKPVTRPKKTFTHGWSWCGKGFPKHVFVNGEGGSSAIRTCFTSMKHTEGDVIRVGDSVLLRSGPRKTDLPFVAKISALWEAPDGEMMMSLLWYYRPEHTEQGRTPKNMPEELFASKHRDVNSVATIDDKCYVLTLNEYCRFKKQVIRAKYGMKGPSESDLIIPPLKTPYFRSRRLPSLNTSPDMIFCCRKVYDFRQKRILKNPV